MVSPTWEKASTLMSQLLLLSVFTYGGPNSFWEIFGGETGYNAMLSKVSFQTITGSYNSLCRNEGLSAKALPRLPALTIRFQVRLTMGEIAGEFRCAAVAVSLMAECHDQAGKPL